MAMLLFATPGFLVVKIMGARVRVVGDFKMDAGPSVLVAVPDKNAKKATRGKYCCRSNQTQRQLTTQRKPHMH